MDERCVACGLIRDLTGHEARFPLGGKQRRLPRIRNLLSMTGAESHPGLPAAMAACRLPRRLPLIAALNHYIGDVSDHLPFRRAGLPYLFFSCGRCWRAVKYEIQVFLTNCRLPTAMRVDDHLGTIRELLRQKDENLAARTPPDHATAVGSEGVLDEARTLFGAGNDRSLLDAFEERLVAWLDDSTSRDIYEQVYRVVGYFSSA